MRIGGPRRVALYVVAPFDRSFRKFRGRVRMAKEVTSRTGTKRTVTSLGLQFT
jgi:hypothetical protein